MNEEESANSGRGGRLAFRLLDVASRTPRSSSLFLQFSSNISWILSPTIRTRNPYSGTYNGSMPCYYIQHMSSEGPSLIVQTDAKFKADRY